MPSHGDELPSFSPSIIPYSTIQDSHETPADTAAQIAPNSTSIELETLGPPVANTIFVFDDFSSFPVASPPIHFSEMSNFSAPADAPEDDRPCSTDADMPGVNAAAAAPRAPPYLFFDGIINLSAPADAPEDGRPLSTDADMPGVNAAAAAAAAPQAPPPVPVGGGGHAAAHCYAAAWATSSEHVGEEEALLRFRCSFKNAVLPDLEEALSPWRLGVINNDVERISVIRFLTLALAIVLPTAASVDRSSSNFQNGELPESCDDFSAGTRFLIVRFTGPDSKGRKPHQGSWKEESMKGMRAAADPSLQPGQGYVGLKKTLELDDDGNGYRWRAHEYTPLLPSDDGTKLIPAEKSLRVEFKEDEPPSSSSKRYRSGAPKGKDDPKIIAPKKSPSPVWEHMTKIHVKVPANNADGSQRKKPGYKVMYAICHHCDKVFNADSGRGTNNLSKHLDSCNYNCTCTLALDTLPETSRLPSV